MSFIKPRQSSSMFVRTFIDIIKNIGMLEGYRKSPNKKERIFYKKCIERGRRFVVVRINEKYYFAPSRFVGYLNNTMENHESDVNEKKEDNRCGGDSTKYINEVMLGKADENTSVDKMYLKFCEDLGIGKPLKYKRRYWKVQKLPYTKWFG